MSKLPLRARPLEASKPMPIYMSEELPDLPEYSAINRAVPQMPSGMKKEEECEHHLQRAMVTGLIIPTPEVVSTNDLGAYDRMYGPTYKVPRQLIHMQPFTMEQDIPDYDMDSEDERWIIVQSKNMKIDPLKFEELMDRLEKNSGHSVVTQSEAKVLLKEDEDLIIAVYDYWLNKRLRTQTSLIPSVRTEAHRGTTSNNNPYLAFRRRVEKMQTRKNRKNDESTYEKMVKLKRDLSRALSLLELVKRRETSKRELLKTTIGIFDTRYVAQDHNGQLLAEVSAMKVSRPAFAPIFSNQFNHSASWPKPVKDEFLPRKEKRQYKKRKHKSISSSTMNDVTGLISSGDDDTPTHDDTPFAFRRKRQCSYHAPLTYGLGDWPWSGPKEGGVVDTRFRFSLTSISTPSPRCVGLTRRRVGRGGRVILDRAGPPMDDFWSSLDFTILTPDEQTPISSAEEKPLSAEEKLFPSIEDRLSADSEVKSSSSEPFRDWLHFRPKSPLRVAVEEEEPFDLMQSSSIALTVQDLGEPSSQVPVQLNLSELFPGLAWEELSRRESEGSSDSDDPPKRPAAMPQPPPPPPPPTPPPLLPPPPPQKEYQSGSLLDRWARFESPPPLPSPACVTAKPAFASGTPLSAGLPGCSAFRTSDYWSETDARPIAEVSKSAPRKVAAEATEAPDVTIEDSPRLPPTPPKETKTPPPTPKSHKTNNVAILNGPILEYMSNNHLIPKKIGKASYIRRNNHLHSNSHRINNTLVMRIPVSENTDILDSAVVSTQVISDKNPNEVLLRKSNQVPMEVT